MEEKISNFNLDLLQPSSSSSSSSSSQPLLQSDDCPWQQQQQLPVEKIMAGEELPLTIFYGGEVCVVNVNQQQARSIMLLAGRGGRIDESMANVLETRNSRKIGLASLSMKRSLQMFLEKRKHRIQSTNPYPN